MYIMTVDGWKPLAQVAPTTTYTDSEGNKFWHKPDHSFYAKDRNVKAFLIRIRSDIIHSKFGRGVLTAQKRDAMLSQVEAEISVILAGIKRR